MARIFPTSRLNLWPFLASAVFIASSASANPELGGQPGSGASRSPISRGAPPRPEPEEDRRKPFDCGPGKNENALCGRQNESFKRAAQAASYLGHYMQHFSRYGVVMKDDKQVAATHRALKACLTASGDCDADARNRVMAALMQYNLGKEVRAMIVENNTNEQNMKSLGRPLRLRQRAGASLINRRQAGQSYDESFKLTARDLAEAVKVRIDPALLQQRNMLGEEFRRQYLNFIDTYSQTTEQAIHQRWHFKSVPPGTAAEEHSALAGLDDQSKPKKRGHHVWELDPQTKAPRIKRERYEEDVRVQKSQPIQTIVKEYKESVTAPEIKLDKEKKQGTIESPISENLKFDGVAIGMPKQFDIVGGEKVTDPEKIPFLIAGNINEKIKKAEKDEARGRPNVVTNVQISIDNFEAYLNKIWPPSDVLNKVK